MEQCFYHLAEDIEVFLNCLNEWTEASFLVPDIQSFEWGLESFSLNSKHLLSIWLLPALRKGVWGQDAG